MERLTSPQIASAIESGFTTVIVPLGATEQHGPHLPIGVDAFVADAIALRMASRLGQALVAPTIRIGQSAHHMAFAGTISVSGDVLTSLLNAYVDSLVRHGFGEVVVFSAHAGNFPVLNQWQAPDGVITVADLDGYLAAMLSPAVAIARSDTTTPHADLTETSLMLALHEGLVHMTEAKPGFLGEVSGQAVFAGVHRLSSHGVLGDPSGATATLGAQVLDSIQDFLVAEVTKARAVQ